jgi:GH15 family glucan-1,4-alpha-glucosidase
VRIEDYALIGDMQAAALVGREYDLKRQRQVGNFPQAFSHLTLIRAATAMAAADGEGAST